ncbi:MAG: PAS domain S-box protein [Methylomicrobium sp.]
MTVTEKDGPQTADFPVIGIGASAGGITPLRSLFKTLPRQTGLAFVVVQHLHPEHPSQLAELLGKSTAMPVCEAVDGIAVQRDHIYIIPPGQVLTLEKGCLRCHPFSGHAHVRLDIIDTFFKSLAADRGQQAIAVVLSGTGNDGAVGVSRIKQAGGHVFVQDPKTANQEAMPRAAINTGAANHVLPVEAIAAELLRCTLPLSFRPKSDNAEPEDAAQPLDEILAIIRRQAGFDLSGYKLTPLLWQIQQRMNVRHVEQAQDYAALLQDDRAELETLIRDIPIHVTNFFRDAEAWVVLEREVIAPLILNCTANHPIRAWTPACSSGEEAYSLAILLAEQAKQMDRPIDFQIFATDAAPEVVARASRGQFSSTDVKLISPERKKRFFYSVDKAYRIKKSLREKMVFAPQHLLEDPPFPDLDLITCRNLLIYLEPYAQKRVIALLHASLRIGGYLFLGSGESLSSKQQGFEVVSAQWRIYRKTGPVTDVQIKFPKRLKRLQHAQPNDAFVADTAHWAVLQKFDLPSVLIDEQFNILRVYGDTDAFLRLPPGEPTLNLLKVIQPALAAELRSTAERAAAERRPVSVEGLPDQEKENGSLSIRVMPFHCAGEENTFRLLVSFIRSTFPASPASVEGSGPASTKDEAFGEGFENLSDTLRFTVEELEASREELQVLNEELRAINDQLNINNEEINEVNAQLRDKIQELEMQSHVLSSGAVMTLFLDKELRIRWFTSAVCELFPLMSYDTGRLITELVPKFVDPRFSEDARTVIRTGQPLEGEVYSTAGQWYLRRIRPFRTGLEKTTGVAITFTDITKRKQAEEALRESEHQFRLLTAATSEILYHMNEDWTEMRVIRGEDFLATTESPNHDWLQKYILPEDQPQVTAAIKHSIATRSVFELEHRIRRADGTIGWVLSRAVPLLNANGEISGWFGAAGDVTARKQTEEALRESEERLRLAWRATSDVIWDWDIIHDAQRWSVAGGEVFGWHDAVDAPQTAAWGLKLMHPKDRQRVIAHLRSVLDDPTRNQWQAEYRFVRANGSYAEVFDRGFVIRDEQGKPIRMIGAMQDITERKRTEEALRNSEHRLRRFYDSGLLGVIYWNMDGEIVDANDKFLKMLGYDREDLAAGRINWQRMTPPEYRPLDERAMKEVQATGFNTVPFEKEYIRKDGARLPVLLAGAMLDEARFNGVAFVLDITDRKRTEAALRESEDSLQFALETSHIGTWDLDLVDYTAHRSLEHDRIFGYNQLLPEWTYEMFLEHVLPEDRLVVDKKFREAMTTYSDWNFECRIRRTDGEVRWIWAVGRHRPDSSGKPRRMAGIVQDITEHKQRSRPRQRMQTQDD